MSSAVDQFPQEAEPALLKEPSLTRGSPIPVMAGVALCLLLAVAQIALAGYSMGVGNQAIQIAFLKKAADPTLYATDQMVIETMPLYPSYFFQMLSPLLAFTSVSSLYLFLQIVTSFLTLAAVYWLSRSIYRMHAAALAAVGLLIAGHLRALAGDAIYSQGFTHTFAALPLAVGALALAYSGKRGAWVWAFGIAGVLFNLHALTSAYVLLMLGAGLLADLWEMPLGKWAERTVLCGTVAGVLALPTLFLMTRQHQVFDADWVNLMRVRSADHSFPSTWWTTGNTDIPRFLLIFALFVLSWSFSPVRRAADGAGAAGVKRGSRITVLMTLAVVVLFVAGYVFTEVWTVPLVIRLQPFRASRMLMILMLVHIAHAAIASIRAGWAGVAAGPDGVTFRLTGLARAGEIAGGMGVLATLGLPALLPLLPLTVLVAMVGGLVVGHLSWRQALVGTGALVVAVLAYLQIDFPLMVSSHELSWLPHATAGSVGAEGLGWMALFAAAVFAVVIGMLKAAWARRSMIALLALLGVMYGWGLFVRERAEPPAGNGEGLVGVAAWALDKTDKGSLFLAPTGFSNFRIQAERSLVGDWRDGTQLYFCAAFGPEWLERVSAIEPGLTISDDGRRLVSRGEAMELEGLSDAALMDLAKKYKANYIVLPTPPKERARALVSAYTDGRYTVFEPRIPPVATRPVPPGVANAVAWKASENFMAETVLPNIERYRKADITIQLVDAAGGPVQELPLKLDQTQLAFVFGASLGMFETNNAPSVEGDQRAALVRPVELQKMPELFNGSMIPFSGKWSYIEPEKGKYTWSDLDKYVNYCASHDMTVELHHLSGIRPIWVQEMGGPGGQMGLNFSKPIPALQAEFNRHCLVTVGRYEDRIKYFQVVNEKYMMQYVPAAFKLLQEKFPRTKFGVSDCVNFWGNGRLFSGGRNDQMKGFDAVKWLQDQGIQPDFFSMHGHHPSNCWPDPRDMYEVFEVMKAAKVRVHISEEYTQIGGQINGPLRGGILTPQLQGELLCHYLTVCFSHPQVDMVNLWAGMANVGFATSNSGMIDNDGKPRPAFEQLKKLFTETWHSHIDTHVPIDGTVKARVFHGKYDLKLTLPDGRVATAKLEVPQAETAKFVVKLDAAKGTLVVE